MSDVKSETQSQTEKDLSDTVKSLVDSGYIDFEAGSKTLDNTARDFYNELYSIAKIFGVKIGEVTEEDQEKGDVANIQEETKVLRDDAEKSAVANIQRNTNLATDETQQSEEASLWEKLKGSFQDVSLLEQYRYPLGEGVVFGFMASLICNLNLPASDTFNKKWPDAIKRSKVSTIASLAIGGIGGGLVYYYRKQHNDKLFNHFALTAEF